MAPSLARKPRANRLQHVRLNRQILAAHSAEDVLGICTRHALEFDGINTVTALHRIAKRGDAAMGSTHTQGAASLGRLLERVQASVPEFRAWPLSNLAWACAVRTWGRLRAVHTGVETSTTPLQEFDSQD